MAERLEEVRRDPKKLKRAFNLAWLAYYAMFILGLFLIIWALLVYWI